MNAQDLKQIEQLLKDQEARLEKKFATKDDLKGLAKKDDLKNMESRFDQKFATKNDLKQMEDRIIDVVTDYGKSILEAVELAKADRAEVEEIKQRVKKHLAD
jgi:hypothetical protein